MSNYHNERKGIEMKRTRNTIESDGFVGIEEAMRYLDISRTALYALMERGELPFVKFGRARRIHSSALTKFAQTAIVTPN
jgi:excisionase family DNA binding protein